MRLTLSCHTTTAISALPTHRHATALLHPQPSVGQWRTDVVDIQAQLDSLESLPYSIHELKLDGSTVHGEGGSADAAWHVAEEDR